jgi:hypothetical protein
VIVGSLGYAARAVLLGSIAALVLGVAYVIVKSGDSSATVVPVVRKPPVQANVGAPTVLGKGRASMASGPAGLWVVRQAATGKPGRLVRFRTPAGAPDHPIGLDIRPYGVAVGDHDVWVLGTAGRGRLAVLERIDPDSGRVRARTTLGEAPPCVAHSFAPCSPVVTPSGVWVPLADQIVRVTPSGTMADRTVKLDGNLWDMASDGHGHLWAIAEVGLYGVDEGTGAFHRWSLHDQLSGGLQASHIVVDDRALWISAFPRDGSHLPGVLIHVTPGSRPKIAKTPRVFPGAGALALVGGGLWLERYNGLGELDRLSQLTGELTGPFKQVPDDVIQIVPRNGDLWLLSYRPTGNTRTVAKVDLTPSTAG